MAAPIDAVINAALKPVESPQPSADGLPYVTHAGECEIAPGLRLECFRLSTGQAVISEKSLNDFMTWLGLEEAAEAGEGV